MLVGAIVVDDRMDRLSMRLAIDLRPELLAPPAYFMLTFGKQTLLPLAQPPRLRGGITNHNLLAPAQSHVCVTKNRRQIRRFETVL
jgi:hypothetical protein